jgi:hypothetical protein
MVEFCHPVHVREEGSTGAEIAQRGNFAMLSCLACDLVRGCMVYSSSKDGRMKWGPMLRGPRQWKRRKVDSWV